MNKSTVSYRKHRPSKFKNIVGQFNITNTLKNSIKNKNIAQSFLFCGPKGTGKTTCARILAKTINCNNITNETEACDKCNSCNNFNENKSLSIYELDAASNNSVENIRNIISQIRYLPMSEKYKVYIIDEVHMLSNSAFNAFLKTLEEPPENTIFILASTDKDKIIPTILSRCQIFNFKKIKTEEIIKEIKNIAKKEKIEYEEKAIELISIKSNGYLRDALTIFDVISNSSTKKKIDYNSTIKNLNILDNEYYFEITKNLIDEKLSEALLIYNNINEIGFNNEDFIIGFTEHLKNLMLCKNEFSINLLEEYKKNKYIEQSNRTSLSFLINSINIINQCNIKNNSENQKINIELSIIRISHINNFIRKIEKKEKKKLNEKKYKKENENIKSLSKNPYLLEMIKELNLKIIK